MRTQMLVALAILISSAAVACAQQSPASAYPAAPGYAPSAASPAPWGYHLTAAPPANAPPTVLPPVPPPAVNTAPLPAEGVIAHPSAEMPAASGGGYGLGEGRYWITGGYLAGWVPRFLLPTPLATTTVGNLQTNPNAGDLRDPDTRIVIGNRIDIGTLHGFQVEAGLFCDDERTWSIDGKGFVLFPSTTSMTLRSDAAGAPFLSRPVYDVVSQTERIFLTSRPLLIAGSLQVDASSELWGAEANVRYHLGGGTLSGDLLVGVRYLQNEENLRLEDRLVPLTNMSINFGGPFITSQDRIVDFDQFFTRNAFYGGQIGGTLRWEDWWWFLRINAKVAFGATQQRVEISGATSLITPTGTTTLPGGILAQSSNIGSQTRTVFGIVPEWSVTGGVHVTDWLRVSVGYSFLFWNRVVRPGDTIDRGVNLAQVPTTSGTYAPGTPPARPAFGWNDGSFWVQAAQAGIELVY